MQPHSTMYMCESVCTTHCVTHYLPTATYNSTTRCYNDDLADPPMPDDSVPFADTEAHAILDVVKAW